MLEDPVAMGSNADLAEEATEGATEVAIEGDHPDSTRAEVMILTEIIF